LWAASGKRSLAVRGSYTFLGIMPKAVLGHSRRSDRVPMTSAFPHKQTVSKAVCQLPNANKRTCTSISVSIADMPSIVQLKTISEANEISITFTRSL
jgi:hypothetical protein